ncbi:BlaI/MecI/CopY family transcriptional regulator, partial [Aminipila sp.]
MREYKMAQSEEKFAELVWENEPVGSGELVRLCEKQLGWKKSTTYTVLKKLCEKGILQNQNAIVTSVLKKKEFYGKQSRQFVESVFGGSLPH